MNAKEKAYESLKQFETVKRWLSTVKSSKTGSQKTQLEYAYRLKAFSEYAKKTPDQLIAERKEQLKDQDESVKRKAEELVSEFFNCQAEKNRMTAKVYHGAVRSFYKYNYVPLQMETPRAAVRRIPPVTLEEFRQIDATVNPRDRALLRFMKDSGISTEDVVTFNYGDIRREFESGFEFVHLRAMRQKTQVNYDTFIGPNAIEALKTYFQMRRMRGEVFNDETPLFLANKAMVGKEVRRRLDDNSVRTVFERIELKTGITVSPHRIRKLFDTYMATKIRSPVVLKYWMGHSVESSDIEGRYIIPGLEEQRKLYVEAYEAIDVRPRKISREELIAEMPDELFESLATKRGMTAREYKNVLRLKKAPDEPIKKEDAESLKTDNDCPDEKHCQRVVVEGELDRLLVQGWRVAAVLPSGKIVVSDE